MFGELEGEEFGGEERNCEDVLEDEDFNALLTVRPSQDVVVEDWRQCVDLLPHDEPSFSRAGHSEV